MHVFENSEFQIYLNKTKEIELFLNHVAASASQRSRIQAFYNYNYEVYSQK
jgi:hypothetical protein